MQVGMGFWASKTLLSAVELGVFSTLANAPAYLPTLRKKLGLHQRSARDFLDTLVALRFLARENGIYSNTADTDLLLDRVKPSYIGGVLEMAKARLYDFWGSLAEALRSGELQNEGKGGGENIFTALYADPDKLRGFLNAMSGVSAGAAQSIAGSFPWRDYKTFMDLGSAQGMVPATLAQAHPHLTGIGFDLPPVRPIFEEFIARRGVADRVQFRGGSFFEEPLPKVDVIVMGHILHDWDLAQKKILLGKAFDALPKGGVVIVYDAVIDDDRREHAFGLMMILNMLIETPGGFDYTAQDCQAWMREAGFSNTRVEPIVGSESMVIGFK